MDTFEDLQQSFPLFKAPIAHASLDEPGYCVRCGKHTSIRVYDACYDCFRTGELDTVIDTEFGMVTRDDTCAGRTHGIPLNDPTTFSHVQFAVFYATMTIAIETE